jgi:hypothetical protein
MFTLSVSTARRRRPQAGARRRLKHIVVDVVKGDELFDAVVFLGEALALPALLPHDDADLFDGEDDLDDTGEFDCNILPVRRAA